MPRVGDYAAYAALRVFNTIFACFPIGMNLRTARALGWVWFHCPRWLPFVGRSLSRHRRRSIRHLRMAMRDDTTPASRRRIALEAMQHWAMVYVIEMSQTPRLLTRWTWARHIAIRELGPVARVMLGGKGCIMLTPHFGNFEVLGYTLALLGFPMNAVMRPLDNDYINEFLVNRRRRSGLNLLAKKGAMSQAFEVLDRHEPLCFIADQDAGRKGLFVDFFGRPASTYKSIGLLAVKYGVPIVVGGARRIGKGYRFEIAVQRIIEPHEWAGKSDELRWITQEYSLAMERMIRAAPEQYLWIHRRWKHQPQKRQLAGMA